MARPRFGAKRRFSGFCVDVSGNFRIFPGIFRICPVIFGFFCLGMFCARFPGVESRPHQKNVNKLTGKIENSQNNPEIPKTPCRKQKSPKTFARLPKSFTRQASQIARKSLQHPTSSLHDFPWHWATNRTGNWPRSPGDLHHFSRKVAEESHERFHKTPQGLRQISPRIPQGNCPRRPPRICPCLEFWKISPKSFPDNRPRMPSEILPHSIRSLHDFLRLAHNNGHRNWQRSPKDFA